MHLRSVSEGGKDLSLRSHAPSGLSSRPGMRARPEGTAKKPLTCPRGCPAGQTRTEGTATKPAHVS